MELPTSCRVTYRSDPPLPESDVVALLALGRTANQQRIYTQQQEQALSNPTTDALLGGALNATVSSRIQKLFGAGSVKVDPNYLGPFGNSTSRIIVEEQLGRNLTLTYATDVNTTGQQLLQAEIAINRHVSLLVARDESGVFSMVVKATRRFRLKNSGRSKAACGGRCRNPYVLLVGQKQAFPAISTITLSETFLTLVCLFEDGWQVWRETSSGQLASLQATRRISKMRKMTGKLGCHIRGGYFHRSPGLPSLGLKSGGSACGRGRTGARNGPRIRAADGATGQEAVSQCAGQRRQRRRYSHRNS